ncbi:unnamed protein product [Closterium sp. Yama58-4]|nr:unnamed protein product [Closterium sp. Yama58-4]
MGLEDGLSDDVRVITEKSLPADASSFGLGAFAGTMFILSSYLAGQCLVSHYAHCAAFNFGPDLELSTLFIDAFPCCDSRRVGARLDVGDGGAVPADYDVAGAEAWFLVAFFLFNTYMLAAAFTLSVVNVVVFGLYELTLVCLIIGDFLKQPVDGGASWITAGGYIGVFTSVSAWYASFAVLFNGMVDREIMYLGKPLINIKGD